MARSLEHLQDQLTGIRWGSITPTVIDSVRVRYHGQSLPIGRLAQTFRDDNRIIVKPFDPQILTSVSAALVAAGFSAYVSSRTTVVVNTPKIHNRGERDQVAAHVRKLGEEARVAIRNIRKKTRQKARKDDLARIDEPLQAMTDDHIAAIDQLVEDKVEALS